MNVLSKAFMAVLTSSNLLVVVLLINQGLIDFHWRWKGRRRRRYDDGDDLLITMPVNLSWKRHVLLVVSQMNGGEDFYYFCLQGVFEWP